ncbi:MAG: GNAT family N-acetyltransferase [Ornithinimicrobium sp.]
MKFAEFRQVGPMERWQDVAVRPMRRADIAAVAALFGQRENVTRHEAEQVASQWIPPTPNRFVTVAEHRGQVHGYGKAEWLNPERAGGDAPTGWYLTGLVVMPAARRHGLGAALTKQRIARMSPPTQEIWYFANLRNRASIALHQRLGFVQQARTFTIPGVTFEGGQSALFRLSIG